MKNKCDCYHESKKIIFWPPDEAPMTVNIGSCWGTRERDECSCGGDRTRCDFYPEVREKALQEIEPEFGEWVSVEGKLPTKNEDVLVYRGGHIGNLMNVYTYLDNDEWEDEHGYWSRTKDEGITHWMPLPEPPKGE